MPHFSRGLCARSQEGRRIPLQPSLRHGRLVCWPRLPLQFPGLVGDRMLKFVVAGLLLASGFGAAQDMKEVPKEAPKPAPAAVATSVPAVPDDLTAAALLYRQGQFDAAIQKYR